MASIVLQPTTIPPGPGRPPRPSLRGPVARRRPGPARLAQQARYRRRRLVAAVVTLAVLTAIFLLVSSATARIAGGDPSSAAGDPTPTSAAASTAAGVAAPATVVVQPGDTLWTIAEAVAPDIDVRVTVDQLIERNGRSPIVPGQELELPGLVACSPSRLQAAGRVACSVVRCPGCGSFDDKVVDSRQADDGSSIRRRRACIDCGRRVRTTFERVEETPLVVVKRSGDREPFDREKVAVGIRLAAKGRPIEADGARRSTS